MTSVRKRNGVLVFLGFFLWVSAPALLAATSTQITQPSSSQSQVDVKNPEDGIQAAKKLCYDLDGSDRILCLRVVKDAKFFDKKAVSLCEKLNRHKTSYGCVQAAVNRVYTPENITDCDDYILGSGVSSCLKERGRPYEEVLAEASVPKESESSESPKTFKQNLKAYIQKALENLKEGRIDRLKLNLEEMQAQVNRLSDQP